MCLGWRIFIRSISSASCIILQIGANSSSAGAQMKKVAEKLTGDDMIAIAAYAASLNPSRQATRSPVLLLNRPEADRLPRRGHLRVQTLRLQLPGGSGESSIM
jgi:hypothetical protein